MKKLVLSLAVLASVALVSCGKNDSKNDSDTNVVVEDTNVAPAEDSNNVQTEIVEESNNVVVEEQA